MELMRVVMLTGGVQSSQGGEFICSCLKLRRRDVLLNEELLFVFH